MPEPEVKTDGTRPEGGAESPAYTAQFKDELKSNEVFKEFPSLNDLGKYVVDTKAKEKTSSADKVVKLEDYAFDKIDFPTGLDVDASVEQWFRKVAFEEGLNKKAAARIYKEYNGLLVNSYNEEIKEGEKAAKEAEEALKKEWGKEYDGNLELFARAVDKFGTADLTAVLKSTGLASNPIIIKTFAAIGKAMSEDKLVDGKPSPGVTMPDLKSGSTGIPTLSYPSMDKK
jgi:hypothetical protein